MWNHQLLLDEYNNNYKPSDKQVNYIKELYNSIKESIIKEQFINRIESIKILKEDQIFVLIEELKKVAPIGISQMLLILSQFDELDIQQLLKKSIEELTQKDAELLLNGPEKFKPWIKEHPIISEDEWEYGWQESDQFKDDKMYYLKFYNMFMLDLDSHSQELIDNLKKYNQFRFRVYQTHGGYHIFITSQLIKYNSNLVFQLTKELAGDIYYAMFANKTGYKIRLSPKINRNEDYIAKYICDIGTIQECKECSDLIKIHDYYIKI